MMRNGMLLGCVAALLTIVASGCCVNPPQCGGGTCGGCGPCGGPFGGLFYNAMTCNAGCGEVYVDEWVSDPPTCCDPCDHCSGTYVGSHGCCPRPFAGLMSFICGYRYEGGCGDCCAPCDTCGGFGPTTGCATCGHPIDGEVIDDGYEHIHPQPTPAARPAAPTPANSASTPKRYERPYYNRGTPARPVSRQTR